MIPIDPLYASKPFKAAILEFQNKPLVIDKIYLPEYLHYGQILVRIKYSGICGSQLGEISGKKGIDKYLPHLLGHEASAEILQVGPGIVDLEAGDNVVLHWRQSKGIQSDPPVYKWNNKKLNAGYVTTFNQYAIVSHNRVTKIAKDFDPRVAALYGCAITTGFGVIENNMNLKIGNSVLVFGAGGVGLNIIQAAKIKGAFPIIAIDLFDNRLKLAKKIGADFILNSKKINNIFTEINKLLGNKKLDFFIDNTGNVEVIQNGYKLLAKEGRLVLVGVPDSKSDITIHSLDMHFGKSIIGSHGGESIPDEDIPRYINFQNNKSINFNEIITEEFILDDINVALDRMVTGDLAGRCLVKL